MWSLRPDRMNRYIFCDESGIDSSRYLVLGALWHDSSHADIEEAIRQVKRKYNLHSEVKWEKAPSKPGQFHEGYKTMVSAFRDLPLYYKALIIDTEKHPLSHPVYTGRDSLKGYYKYYYQLLYNGLMSAGRSRNHLILLDERSGSERPRVRKLEQCIEDAALRDGFPDAALGRCCDIQTADSRKVQSLQMVDLLTGILGAAWNKRVTNQTKLDLIDHLSTNLSVDLLQPTGRSAIKFNRWVFRPNS